MSTANLISNITATTTLPTSLVPTDGATKAPVTVQNNNGILTFEADVRGTGAVSATVSIYPVYEIQPVTVDATPITITLSGTTSAVGSSTVSTPCNSFVAIVTAISGTGATVNAKVNG